MTTPNIFAGKAPFRWAVGLLSLVVAAAPVWAQPDPKKKKDKDKAKADEGVEELVAPLDPEIRKEFSAGEVRRICDKYEGRFIGYYGDVYKVVQCQRRLVISSKVVYGAVRAGDKVLGVDGDVVAALPEGEPFDTSISEQTARGCKVLEAKYVSYSAVDVYYVEKCKKRLFPDWTTYLEHRAKHGDVRGEILALSWIEFALLPDGEPLKSVVDDMFARLLSGDAGVDVIPVDEACAGVDGRVVSFYSRLYRIESCRKREILDPELYMKRFGLTGPKIQELRSEQWLSLPDGKPVELPPAEKTTARGGEGRRPAPPPGQSAS